MIQVTYFWRGLLIAIVATTLIGCATTKTTGSGQAGVDRGQMMLVSSKEVEAASAKQYKEVIAKAQSEGKLNRDANMTARVQRIAQRLEPHTGVFRKDAPGWPWEVNVITSDDVNAWCMAGGKIAFYTGLIQKLNLTDDEIAAVMGHEIAHALREHSREKVSRAYAQQLGVGVIAQLAGLGEGGAKALGMATEVAVGLPNSRTMESESDAMGVEIAARAGYDPRAAITLWEKMNKAGGGRTPQFMSTHPSPENRMSRLRELMPKMVPLYEQAKHS
jgi:predicted Zn-dependent protease